MSTENNNPAVVEALLEAEDDRSLKDHINNQIVTLGKAMQRDTIEVRGPLYARKNFSVGALLAYDPEVRSMAQRAGVRLNEFDEAIGIATQAIQTEFNKNNTTGQKLAKTIRGLYENGQYR